MGEYSDKNFDQQTRELLKIIKGARHIAVMTGAGISVPSGIPDFRSATGLYSTPFGDFPAETMLSHDFFVEHTAEFYKFYKQKMLYPSAEPNSAHRLLVRLEELGKLSAVITQNIDGLHQKAGSRMVYELHGSVLRNRCVKCNKFFGLDHIVSSKSIPTCDECSGVIKPEVVLYGESLDSGTIAGAVADIRRADVMIIIGTSLVVYPAAGFVDYFRGDKLVLINKGATSYDGSADLVINEDCAKVADRILGML